MTPEVFSFANRLLPSKQVRKLDGCDHEFHTACFQNWVNAELSTNTAHQGGVPCPNCRAETPGVHSVQEIIDGDVPSPAKIQWTIALVGGAVQGFGTGLFISGPCSGWHCNFGSKDEM